MVPRKYINNNNYTIEIVLSQPLNKDSMNVYISVIEGCKRIYHEAFIDEVMEIDEFIKYYFEGENVTNVKILWMEGLTHGRHSY